MYKFALPPAISDLVSARNAVREHYVSILRRQGSEVDLKFSFDGNLVGDIGEALAVELSGVKLVAQKSMKGIDAYASDGRSVQVKASGTKRGGAFRKIENPADHLLVFCLDFEAACGAVIYNGKECRVRRHLPDKHDDQRMISRQKIIQSDVEVPDEERLKLINR